MAVWELVRPARQTGTEQPVIATWISGSLG